MNGLRFKFQIGNLLSGFFSGRTFDFRSLLRPLLCNSDTLKTFPSGVRTLVSASLKPKGIKRVNLCQKYFQTILK